MKNMKKNKRIITVSLKDMKRSKRYLNEYQSSTILFKKENKYK